MSNYLYIFPNNDPSSVFEKHFTLTCPHCNTRSNLSAVAIPRFEFLTRFKPQTVGIGYRCDGCNAPVFLRFKVYTYQADRVYLHDTYEEVERPKQTFDLTR